MSIKNAICDDKAEDIKLLSDALYTYDSMFDISTYIDSKTLIDDLMASDQSMDILLLDIYMPGMDGIETARKIRESKKDIKNCICFIEPGALRPGL